MRGLAVDTSAYLSDPCGTLSIPCWKALQIRIPEHMRIVHDREFDASLLTLYTDEAYFRLRHDLQQPVQAAPGYVVRTAGEADLPLMAQIINRSYTDLSVTQDQLAGYRRTPAFAEDMWILLLDARTRAPVGCGIADFDPEMREGVLEWIQVLPEARGRGAGQALVGELLRRLAGRADFATVSGKVHNPTHPERLYRRCGFTGSDVWHILTKR